MAAQAGDLIGHARAQQRFHRTQHGDGQRWRQQQPYRVPGKVGQRKSGQRLRNAAKPRANRVNRPLHGVSQRGERYQRHDGPWHAARHPEGAAQLAAFCGPHHLVQ